MSDQHNGPARRRFLKSLTGGGIVGLSVPPPQGSESQDGDSATIELMRTAIVVRDLDRSLAFYREGLGFIVDNEIRGNTEAVKDSFPFGLDSGRFHLVILRSSPPSSARIALLNFSGPFLPARPRRAELGVGDLVFVIETDHIDAVVTRLEAAGTEFYRPLYESERTMADGNRYRVRNMTCWDPDHVFIEISQRELI